MDQIAKSFLAVAVIFGASLTAMEPGSAESSYYQKEQERERIARDRARLHTDRAREEYQRRKWQADRDAERAAERRGDWQAARNLSKWEDYRAQKYWEDKRRGDADRRRLSRDQMRCRQDGAC